MSAASRPALVVVLSPYHLTTREAPAMGALLLADRVVTLRPAPLGGASREAVARAMDAAPWFLRLLDSWRWSTALWRAGVVSGEHAGDSPEVRLREVCADLAASDRLRALRPFAHKELFIDERAHLEVICRDLLRGGADPGVSIPTAAAVDRFASVHGLWAVRDSGGASVAQRAESRMASTLFEFAAPVLTHASGSRVLEARRELAGELHGLRAAMQRCVLAAGEGGAPGRAGEHGVDGRVASARAGLRDAIDRYAARFESVHDGLTFGDDDLGERVACGWVTVSASMLPGDAVWKSSLAAIGRLDPRETRGCGDGASSGAFVALGLRTMTLAPDRRSPGAAAAV